MKYNNYKTYPLAQFNRKLVTKLKKQGYRNIRVDFDTPPPVGDFHEDPNLPIIALFSCEQKLNGNWLKLRALEYVKRGVRLNDQFHEEAFEKNLEEAFQYCLEHTKPEEQQAMEDAEAELRELYETVPQ